MEESNCIELLVLLHIYLLPFSDSYHLSHQIQLHLRIHVGQKTDWWFLLQESNVVYTRISLILRE